MTLKEYCASCKNEGSYKCHSCMGKYYDGVLQGAPTKYIKKPQTNADRIRAMSDEELSKFIGHNSLCDQIQNDNGAWCKKQSVCEGCLVEWLKQPAEE